MPPKVKPTIVNDIPSTDLPGWRRSQRFENAKLFIQVGLMAGASIALLTFLALIFYAGIFPYCYTDIKYWCIPDTLGTHALSALFVDIAANAKAIALFALGFFFKEYLSGAGNGKKAVS